MSIFQLPGKVARMIEWRIRDFLWATKGIENGSHLIGWNRISNQKNVGGLGLANLRDWNIALITKWVWELPMKESPLYILIPIITNKCWPGFYMWFTNCHIKLFPSCLEISRLATHFTLSTTSVCNWVGCYPMKESPLYIISLPINLDLIFICSLQIAITNFFLPA